MTLLVDRHVPRDQRDQLWVTDIGGVVVARSCLMDVIEHGQQQQPGDSDVVEVEICNPVAVEPVEVPSHSLFLHAGRGRGLRIVEVLAAATGMQHRFEVLDGAYDARVHIPRRLWHPSLQQPKRIAGETGQVAVLHELAWAASGE